MAMRDEASLWVDELPFACTRTWRREREGIEVRRWTFHVEIPADRLRRDALLGHRGEPFVAMFFAAIPRGRGVVGLQAIASTPQDIVTSFVYRGSLSAAVEGLASPMDITIRLDLGPPPPARRQAAPGPADMRASRLRLHRFGHTFLQRHHRLPTASEVVAGLDMQSMETAATIAATHAPLCAEDVRRGALPRLQLPTADPAADRDLLRESQATLLPREEHVLRQVQSVRDGGQDFEVTRERIRPIEAKALRHLRQPADGRRLKAFIED